MFTGIVEQIGTVKDVSDHREGKRLVISGTDLGELAVGASIAVNGVCLTAVAVDPSEVTLDLVPETLSRTTLAEAGAGDPVNLERPMPANGRFDGHVVQGHVDAIGRVVAVEKGDEGTVVVISAPEQLMPYVVEKGSITVDGVSLTVASVSETSFRVALIPHTLEITTLGLRNSGDAVNLETDIIAKYVERLLDTQS